MVPLPVPALTKDLLHSYVCCPFTVGNQTRLYYGVVAQVSDTMQEVHVTFPYEACVLHEDHTQELYKFDELNKDKGCYLVSESEACSAWGGWHPSLRAPQTQRRPSNTSPEDVGISRGGNQEVSHSDNEETDSDEDTGDLLDDSDDEFLMDVHDLDAVDEEDRRLFEKLISEMNYYNWR